MLPDLSFCKTLPKVECLQEIWESRRDKEPNFSLEAPNIVLASDKVGQSVETYLYSLVNTLDAIRYATRSVLSAFADDGVVYLELRTTPRNLSGDDGDVILFERIISAIVSVIEDWNGDHAERMRAGLLLSIDRAKHSPVQATEIVDLAGRFRHEGRPVLGLDLCGDPNSPSDIAIFRSAFKLASERRLPFTIHFAEVPNSSTERELAEILSWNPSRLGHVIHVPLEMRQQILSSDIGLELCLSCNVLAGMLPGERQGFVDHHFGWWWKAKGRISLGTDDVGVFASPSSEEHMLAAQHFGLSRQDLVRLSRTALTIAFGDTSAAQHTLEYHAW
ncbi:hypothetical protein IAR55_004031 [Kwoniella newhampshirensis]|uniref:Adenosine deaminase domain-containing protein n=1 Tax=Kwoniella newhampshirensis TaxID=1651941 RepID=A0AAW0YYP2_9TREE